MQTRDRIQGLVDQLPGRELPAVERLLEELTAGSDPLLRALGSAPEDDESLRAEEAAAIQEGRDALVRGEVVSTTELRRSLGL